MISKGRDKAEVSEPVTAVLECKVDYGLLHAEIWGWLSPPTGIWPTQLAEEYTLDMQSTVGYK